MAKKPKSRGASRGGRPRKTGARHSCGKLVQAVEPNARVVEGRKAMLGSLKADLSVAEDAMRLALAHGWLTEQQHRAGETYARDYGLAHAQRRMTGGLSEAPDASSRDLRPIGQMGSAEIVAAFDNIAATTQRPGASEARQVEARRRYNSMSSAMTSAEQGEVFGCFCQRSWPQWIVWRSVEPTRDLGEWLVWAYRSAAWDRKRLLLVAGLDAIIAHLRAASKRGNTFRNVRVA